MGKKSRKNREVRVPADSSANSNPPTVSAESSTAVPTPTPTPTPTLWYPSDGPMDLELLQTESPSLQVKLNHLTELARANDRAGFVSQFVPLDLSAVDTEAYLQDLTTAPEADGQWANLASEVAAIAAGRGVDRIEGDQVTRAVFYFEHPLLEKCDREVSFVCADGEWRADA
jgi:hypothetical protein